MNESQTALREHIKVMDSFTQLPPQNEYTYRSMYDFVLDRGEIFDAETSLTKEEKKILAAACRGRKFELKQCFYNAQMLVLNDVSGELQYVEGWAHAGIIPVHHGWVLLGGKVIDLTWRDRKGNSRVGRVTSEYAYLGVPFDKDLIHSRILKTGWASSVIDDYENAWPVLKWPRINARQSQQVE